MNDVARRQITAACDRSFADFDRSEPVAFVLNRGPALDANRARYSPTQFKVIVCSIDDRIVRRFRYVPLPDSNVGTPFVIHDSVLLPCAGPLEPRSLGVDEVRRPIESHSRSGLIQWSDFFQADDS